MRRLSQSMHQELSDLMIANRAGDPVYETVLYELPGAPEAVLCVSAPQALMSETTLAVDACTPERFAATADGAIVHDVLGVRDEVIVWISPIPAYNGIPRQLALLKQSQSFETRASVWDAEAEELGLSRDDAGNLEPPGLGDRDLGESDA